jgi:hypothetical protein
VDSAIGAGDGAGASVAAQIALSLRHGGFGRRVVSECKADAARQSASALTQATMAGVRPAFRPFDGPLHAGLAGTWERFHDAAAGKWAAASRALSPAIMHPARNTSPFHTRGRGRCGRRLPSTRRRHH